jgi:hypothetical protein
MVMSSQISARAETGVPDGRIDPRIELQQQVPFLARLLFWIVRIRHVLYSRPIGHFDIGSGLTSNYGKSAAGIRSNRRIVNHWLICLTRTREMESSHAILRGLLQERNDGRPTLLEAKDA